MRSHRQMSILPPGMDGRQYNGTHGKDGGLQDWQRNATETKQRRPSTQIPTHTVKSQSTEDREDDSYNTNGSTQLGGFDTTSPLASPRSIQGGEKPRGRRQGLVFQDAYGSGSIEGSQSGPPVSLHSRTRTRTLEEPPRMSATSTSVPKSRLRVGSVHSTNSSSFHEVAPRPVPDAPNSVVLAAATRSPQLQKSNSVKGGRRLVKRSSRPTSPLPPVSDAPSVDSLPFPVATADANKILILMKSLCGSMRGKVEYQAAEHGAWFSGTCYIDEVKGSLMFEGPDEDSYQITVIADLRGCRVKPLNLTQRQEKCLEISNPSIGVEVRLLPIMKAEFDHWLAALLCWQQVRNGTLPASPQTPKAPSGGERRPGLPRHESSNDNPKDANIIKVAKLLLWDKGVPSSPKAIVRRPSTRDLRSAVRSWRRVSCILQDNGEFKLLTENDVTLLSVIQLSQLSRCAIQRLDKSVFDEEYCIAIFPQYASTSTQLSIFRPVYIALESRVLFEVWFVLLRAFSIPELYGQRQDDDGDEYEIPGVLEGIDTLNNNLFRIEKSLNVRVVEAKIRSKSLKSSPLPTGKHSAKVEQDASVGDYFAEVVLDGEVRARTITKTETKNPFWREECEFLDLPSHLPRISIVLKRIDRPDVATHGFLSSSSVHMHEPSMERISGTIDVPIEKLERGKDSESWWPILDDHQEKIGEMLVKLRLDELVVLLAKDYQPLSELLHRFSTGLTVQISQVIPTSLRRLSETLMNIFQVSGHAGEWLMGLVEDEIDGVGKEMPVRRIRWSRRMGSNESFNSVSDREQTVRDMGKSLNTEANLLFRGSTLLTQALDFHMQRLGKEYLDEVLSEKINEINTLNPDCEVDPSRLSHSEDANKNWALLISLTTDIWNSIAASATRCPAGLRQVLKYIRAVAEDRYGDFLRTVPYTSVSGFLFLRFFCPAILNPKLFGLLRDHPQPKAQRTLTLIAKSLQALANLSTFGQKESWMEPMNRFLGSHRQPVKDFLDAVCAIPAERNTFALPASYSTPITILARLPPTSREGFPSLPYLIDHARNFAALIKIWLEATANDITADDLDGDLLKFHQLCISLQRRTNECLLIADRARSTDPHNVRWEDVEDLDNSTVHDLANMDPEIYSPRWSEYASPVSGGQITAPGSAGSEVGSRERRERQGFWETKFGKESKYQRPYDPDATLQSSPPSRGQSRNGNRQRNFLSGLRRKGKDTTGEGLDKDNGTRPGSSWNEGMI